MTSQDEIYNQMTYSTSTTSISSERLATTWHRNRYGPIIAELSEEKIKEDLLNQILSRNKDPEKVEEVVEEEKPIFFDPENLVI